MKPKLYLIDSANVIYRAFHAIQNLRNSRGFPTNAVFGFANMLLKVMRDHKPDAVAAIFDPPGRNFRDEMYAEYKANRSAMPDDLGPQMPFVKAMLDGFNVKRVELPGCEADDVIATLALRAAAAGWEVVIVSGDKDLMQLVNKDIKLLDTMKDILYDRDAVIAKWGVPPEKLGDVLALMGDAVDNIPGVPGVGEKTAVKLVQEYGSLNNLLASTASLKGKLREKIENHQADARLSRALVALKEDCEISEVPEDFRTQEPNRAILGRFFQDMEFRRLATEFEAPDRAADVTEESFPDIRIVAATDALRELANSVCEGSWVLDPIGPGLDLLVDDPFGFVLSAGSGDQTFYLPLRSGDGGLAATEVAGVLSDLCMRPGVRWVSSDAKNVAVFLVRYGQTVSAEIDDLGLMSYVLDPSKDHDLDACVLSMADRRIPVWEELLGKGKTARAPQSLPAAEFAATACRRAHAVLACVTAAEARLRAENIWELYATIERPLVRVLAAMESAGIRVDAGRLAAIGADLGARLETVEKEIFALAGGPFNIQSPKQLNEIMFDKLQYATKGIKKTKTGQLSTDSDVLEKLALQYPLPRLILQYRTLAKLKGTYVDALPPLIRADGRIHTRFNQMVAATGRLSSQDPNLQNIPIRDEDGKKIREAFVASPGNSLISFDYSQVELRILAHVADDAILQDSFLRGEDVHRRTAAEVFGVDVESVDAAMRRKAKAVNFGIAYGQTSYGLSQSLGIGNSEAQGIIDRYFERYAGVKKYLESMPAAARKQGYVSTLFGRRRLLPDINHANMQIRQFAERTAINTPIQGSAADLIKAAMIRVADLFAEKKLKAQMLLQVHDELLFDVPLDERETVRALVKNAMENALALKVPLVVDIGEGATWAAAHF